MKKWICMILLVVAGWNMSPKQRESCVRVVVNVAQAAAHKEWRNDLHATAANVAEGSGKFHRAWKCLVRH